MELQQNHQPHQKHPGHRGIRKHGLGASLGLGTPVAARDRARYAQRRHERGADDRAAHAIRVAAPVQHAPGDDADEQAHSDTEVDRKPHSTRGLHGALHPIAAAWGSLAVPRRGTGVACGYKLKEQGT